jgi:hypothetical protein
LRVADGLIGVQLRLLVFAALPKLLDKHIVAPTTFPVYAEKSIVSVLESRHANNRRLVQPRTANKYTKPRCIGSGVRDRA